MSSICFYFQVHQPLRVKKYTVFDIGNDREYFKNSRDERLDNKKILEKVARKAYLPATALLYDLLQKHPEFKVSFSISGTLLDQLEEHLPEVIDSFKRLISTGRVELLNETYYHSLAIIHSKDEFRRQVEHHQKRIDSVFGVKPKVFRNTELIYSNDLSSEVAKMGYSGILLEGADHILGWRSPNYIYSAKDNPNIKLLLRNYKLSDDIAFRFSNPHWEEFPLQSSKFANWVSQVNGAGEVVNLFMDFETFGEHHWEDTGIFEFLRTLPRELLKHPDNDFVTPSEAIERYEHKGELDVPDFTSWADIERDLSAWLSNPMQSDAMKKLYLLEKKILSSGDEKLIEDWRRLQTSDHFYYMCTKWFADGDVHKYFNPYETPYEAFINYMNVVTDLKLRIAEAKKRTTIRGKGRKNGRTNH